MKYILMGLVLLGFFGMAQSLQQEEENEKINSLIKLMYDDLSKEESFLNSTFAFRIKSYQSNTFNNSDSFNYFKQKLVKLFLFYVEEEPRRKSDPDKLLADMIKVQRQKDGLKIKKNLTPRATKTKVDNVFAKVRGKGATHLIDIYFDSYGKKFRLDIFVYEVKTRLLVWNKSWKVKSGNSINHVGLKTSLDEVHNYKDNIKITHALSIGLGTDLISYAELLFLVDFTLSYQDHGSELPLDFAAGLNFGLQISLNLFDLADYWNDEINLYFVVRSMLGAAYFIQQTDLESEQQVNLKNKRLKLNTNFDLGVMFALRESSFYFEVGINPLDVSPYFVLGSRH